MAANFNNAAWFYDRLSRLVYGNALVKAQVWLLDYVPQNSTILIAGGGTGWILEELAKIHPTGLTITYVEIAPAMIARSKKRNIKGNQVIFISDAIEYVEFELAFDVVITPFLFDNFKEINLDKVFGSMHQALKPGGLWLNVNFQLTGKWWQQVLLKSMFLFFRLLCNIEGAELPGIKKQFEKNGYTQVQDETFYGKFVTSQAYKKTNKQLL